MFFCVVLPISSVLSQSTLIVSFRTINLVNIVHSILPFPSVLPKSTPVKSLRIADLTNSIVQVSSFIFCMRSCPSHLFYLSNCLNFLDQFYTNFVDEPLQNWFQQLCTIYYCFLCFLFLSSMGSSLLLCFLIVISIVLNLI